MAAHIMGGIKYILDHNAPYSKKGHLLDMPFEILVPHFFEFRIKEHRFLFAPVADGYPAAVDQACGGHTAGNDLIRRRACLHLLLSPVKPEAQLHIAHSPLQAVTKHRCFSRRQLPRAAQQYASAPEHVDLQGIRLMGKYAKFRLDLFGYAHRRDHCDCVHAIRLFLPSSGGASRQPFFPWTRRANACQSAAAPVPRKLSSGSPCAALKSNTSLHVGMLAEAPSRLTASAAAILAQRRHFPGSNPRIIPARK